MFQEVLTRKTKRHHRVCPHEVSLPLLEEDEEGAYLDTSNVNNVDDIVPDAASALMSDVLKG